MLLGSGAPRLGATDRLRGGAGLGFVRALHGRRALSADAVKLRARSSAATSPPPRASWAIDADRPDLWRTTQPSAVVADDARRQPGGASSAVMTVAAGLMNDPIAESIGARR